ncbi:hypothetical protein LOTGIDRAFT_103020 [Lottia gigantea]|uniref:Fatty acid hydroxylase domain-containing protein n=1 Tax=Lottia gigantea TaxID=225164 RepID=V4AN46_LOTGI|nr:hypothetical protein LOTGIDRAFT_103020 [Lottia gigantea]ESP05589.1 hypothetical protein LOTGIDRAFT_103020 [Lottia gigantea]
MKDLASKQNNRNIPTPNIVLFIRAIIVLVFLLGYIFREYLQTIINESWSFLLESSVFNSVYFESWWATLCYAIVIPVYPFGIHYIEPLDKYKIDPSVTYVHQTIMELVGQAVIYLSPLMLMDTFMVKKYAGVEPTIWVEKRQSWIQTTRALPEDPPTLFFLVFDLFGSILIYDALFFFFHFAIHKNNWLYKNLHAVHHHHDKMHAHITNQLSVSERIILILSANFALKILNSHPLTRLLFVPVFIFLLVDNHLGYDLPFGWDKIVPFHLMGGPRKHYHHHIHGGGNYQPFLCYLDQLLEKRRQKKV